MKTKLFLILLFTSHLVFCQINVNPESNTASNTITKGGIGLGSVLAIVLSWDRNKSILLAILHGIFSWFYVIYFAITRK